MRIPVDPPPPSPASQPGEAPANQALQSDNNRFDEAVQDALNAFCNARQQSYDDFLQGFTEITAADVTPPWNCGADAVPPLLSEPVSRPHVSIMESARNSMIERLLRLNCMDRPQVGSSTDSQCIATETASPGERLPQQELAAPPDGIEEISSGTENVVGSLVPGETSGAQSGSRVVQFDNFVDDEGAADESDAERDGDDLVAMEEFNSTAPYQASFAATADAPSVEPAASSLDNRTLDTFLTWPSGVPSKSEKNANNQLQKISDIVTENLPMAGFVDSLEEDMLQLSCCDESQSAISRDHQPPPQNDAHTQTSMPPSLDKNSKLDVSQSDALAQTLICRELRNREDSANEDGLLELIQNEDSDSESDFEYNPLLDLPNPGEIEDEKDGMSEKDIEGMKNIRKLDFSARYHQHEDTEESHVCPSDEACGSNVELSSSDCIEPFSLDENFDYDNVVLSTKFTAAETRYLQSLSQKPPVQPPYAPGYDPDAADSESD